jgi:proteasome-associated ATPase
MVQVPQQNARGDGRPDDEDDAWRAPAGPAGARAEGGAAGLSDDEITLLQVEVALLRERLGGAPERVAALEAELSAAQRELESSVAQNGRLAETLRSARSRIEDLKAEVERLTAPPHTYGTFLGAGPGGGLMVTVQGRKLQVEPTPAARADRLEPGQELLLNDAMQVVGVGRFEDRGELMSVAELLDDGRALVVGRGDDERVIHLAGRVREAGVRAGDTLLVDVRSGTASERIDRSEVERLVLEEAPDVDYADIGGLASQIEAIRDAIELPYLHADLYRRYALRAPKGILLYGPPGCGKTMIAKAVASSLARRAAGTGDGPVRSTFLSVKGPELLNKYVGETERQIRLIFQRARERSRDGHPVVVFFDEMEALFRTRGTGVSTDVETTIVPQLLAEIDGVESLQDVIVIGASNREDMIDPAILRPGRLDVKIRIERPDRHAAHDILRLSLTPDVPIDARLVAEHDGDVVAAVATLVSTAVEHVYDERPGTEFVEVRYGGGAREVLHFHDFSSGAMLASIVARAKRRAVKREASGDAAGIGVEDVVAAVREEFHENEDLPSTANPEEWARVGGRRGEPVVAVRPLAGARAAGGTDPDA